MAFPGPYATIIYNEDGEPMGWDNNYPSEPDYYAEEEDYNRGWDEEDEDVDD